MSDSTELAEVSSLRLLRDFCGDSVTEVKTFSHLRRRPPHIDRHHRPGRTRSRQTCCSMIPRKNRKSAAYPVCLADPSRPGALLWLPSRFQTVAHQQPEKRCIRQMRLRTAYSTIHIWPEIRD